MCMDRFSSSCVHRGLRFTRTKLTLLIVMVNFAEMERNKQVIVTLDGFTVHRHDHGDRLLLIAEHPHVTF